VAVLRVIAGVIMISFSAVFVNLADMGPSAVGFYRMLIGGGLLVLLARARGQSLAPGTGVLKWAIMAGLIFGTDLWFWHKSVYPLGPGLATIMANFQVFFLAAYGVLVYGEGLGLKRVAAIPLALAGLFMLVGPDWTLVGPDYKAGLVYALIASVCYAALIITMRKSQSVEKRLSPVANMAVISLVTGAVLGMGALAGGESFAVPNLKTLAAVTGYGIFGQVIGWLLITTGLPRIPVSRAGLIIMLQPALAFVWDVLFFARPAGPLEWVGAALAVSAIALGSMK